MVEAEIRRERRIGLWVAWYRGHAIAAHPSERVLARLMEAEGLADQVRYRKEQSTEGESVPVAAD